jgi:hypothetical protein
MMMTLIEMFLEICIYQSKAKDHDEQAQAREMRGRVIENPALHNEKQFGVFLPQSRKTSNDESDDVSATTSSCTTSCHDATTVRK